MNLLPTSDQQQIIDAIADFLSTQAPVSRFREYGSIGSPDAKLLPHLGELGFLGVSLSEKHGGTGLSSAEEMLVFREFGRHLVSPFIFGQSLGARLAAISELTELRDQLLTGLCQIGIANPIQDVIIGPKCSGEFHLFDALKAPHILLVSEEGAALISSTHFEERHIVNATDAIVILERATLAHCTPDIWIESSEDPIYRRALMLLAAYATGIGEATRDMAIEYANVREQFGKPIGSFQAIKHICADMAIRAEAAFSQTCFASLVMAEDREDSDFQVVSSKIVATEAALKNSSDNIQVHGAIGFTADANAHHYLKRSHVIDLLWGNLRKQRQSLLNLPAASARDRK